MQIIKAGMVMDWLLIMYTIIRLYLTVLMKQQYITEEAIWVE